MNRKTKKKIMIVAVAVFFLTAGIWYVYRVNKPKIPLEDKTELTEILNDVMTEKSSVPDEPIPEKEPEKLVVHVCGAVQEPGVYTLLEGSRLHEAVTAAGGFLPEADAMYHNLARNVKDGERIYILSCEETKELTIRQQVAGEEGNQGEQTESTVVNLNTATVEQLTSLPGIGESKAENILAYRQQVGQFTDIEEIKNISGIGDAMFERIKDKITVK